MSDDEKIRLALKLLDEVFHSESTGVMDTLKAMIQVRNNVDYYLQECEKAS